MKRLATALLLGSSLVLSACSSDPTKEIVNYRGGDMKGTIKVARSAVVETPGGLPKAQATLKNTAGTTQKFEYKIVWFDSNDMSLDEDNRPWKPASVAGKDETTISATGPSDRAKRFQIQIREPQGVTQ
ncbi:MAG: DUF1425 domain-containing protein [Moraxellaceae bacterium]|nr:DUF1425 domain-containing protein [Moraxellaceae bacterium]